MLHPREIECLQQAVYSAMDLVGVALNYVTGGEYLDYAGASKCYLFLQASNSSLQGTSQLSQYSHPFDYMK